jgi:hypothetical protein
LKTTLAVASLLLFPLSVSSQQFDPGSIETSVVQIAVVFPDKSVEVEGTGFVVGDGTTVISAGHVYRDAQKRISDRKGGDLVARKFSRIDSNKFQVPISFKSSNNGDELVAFRWDKTTIQQQWPSLNLKSLPVSTSDPQLADQVVTLGYYGTNTLSTPSQGRVIGFVQFSAEIEDVILNIQQNPGDSGSPIVRVSDGSVVGIVLSAQPKGVSPSVTLAAKASRVRSLLN